MAIPEVLSADVVLLGPGLLMSSEEMESFRESVQTEVVSTGGGFVVGPMPNPPIASNVLSLARDRITLDLSQNRSFRMEPNGRIWKTNLF
jgi:hypothetical protein